LPVVPGSSSPDDDINNCVGIKKGASPGHTATYQAVHKLAQLDVLNLIPNHQLGHAANAFFFSMQALISLRSDMLPEV